VCMVAYSIKCSRLSLAGKLAPQAEYLASSLTPHSQLSGSIEVDSCLVYWDVIAGIYYPVLDFRSQQLSVYKLRHELREVRS